MKDFAVDTMIEDIDKRIWAVEQQLQEMRHEALARKVQILAQQKTIQLLQRRLDRVTNENQ